jgi:hypothetical protein
LVSKVSTKQNKTKQTKQNKTKKKAFSGQESQRAVEPSFLEIDQEAREGTRKRWV